MNEPRNRSDEPSTIDEMGVRRALAKLDALAAAHPDLIDHTASRWTDNLDEVDRLTNGDPMPPTKKPKHEANVIYTFRLQPSLIARLDVHAERLTAATPGLTITRSDALRMILTSTLDAAEADKPRKGK